MTQLILVFHVLIAIALIVLVLLQQGKGAQLGAAFGSGASQTIFGSQGSGSFLMKVTATLAVLFFATSLFLGYLAAQQTRQDPLQGLTASTKATSSQNHNKPGNLPIQGPLMPSAGVPIPAGELPSNNDVPPSR